MGAHKHTDECKKMALGCTVPEGHKHTDRCRGRLEGEKKDSLLCWIEENHRHHPKRCYTEVIKCRMG
jgi:hypothetical protein